MASGVHKRAPRERGFALIVVVSLVVLIASYLLVSALNKSSSQISNAREQTTMSALLKAKSALIAYAASEQWQLYKNQSPNQPGGLPCPDQDDDGDADCVGAGITNSISLIGRLPWKTIGTEDLRDSSGERLWYAVSRNFRKLYGTTVINSDTPGQLTVTGTASGSNIVAVIIAPGQVTQGQNRVTGHNSAAAYLEGFNANDSVNFIFTTNALPTDALNDRLVAITQADLMAAVEPVVSARIERDVKPYLVAYFNQWGAFPFPAKFAEPAPPGPGTNGPATTRPQAAASGPDYSGDASQAAGLLPISTLANTPTPYPWSGSSVTKSSGVARVDINSCVSVALSSPFPPPSTGWQCSLRVRSDNFFGSDIIFFPRVSLSSSVGTKAGTSLATLPDVSTITTTIDGASATVSSPSIHGSLTAAGAGTVTYDATLPISCMSSCSDRTVVVTIPDLTVSRLTSAADSTITAASNASPIVVTTSAPHNFPTGAAVTISNVSGNGAANGTWTVTVIDATRFSLNGSSGSGTYTSGGTASAAAWFIANEWFRQTYYAVSPGYLPGGSGACTARPTPPAAAIAPSCLMISNLDPAKYPTVNDKRAILILMGRSLTGNTRPSASLAEYFEGANAPLVAAPYAYENRPGVPTSINDRVVVISP
ncbi:MAG TPA: ubiquitin-activating E1 FCCH domain-containing protein [Burkholderiales bacterium]